LFVLEFIRTGSIGRLSELIYGVSVSIKGGNLRTDEQLSALKKVPASWD
jgi:hypothetical protein